MMPMAMVTLLFMLIWARIAVWMYVHRNDPVQCVVCKRMMDPKKLIVKVREDVHVIKCVDRDECRKVASNVSW